jgi:hypothetical protein
MFHNTVQNTNTHTNKVCQITQKKLCLWIIWSFPSCDKMTQFAMLVFLSAISAAKPCPWCATSTRSSQWVQDLVTSQSILWTKIINSAIMMMNKIFYYLSANMLVNEMCHIHTRDGVGEGSGVDQSSACHARSKELIQYRIAQYLKTLKCSCQCNRW